MVLLASPVSVAPARVHPTSRAAGYSLVSTPSYYSYDSDDMHKKYGGWPCEELFTAEVPRPCAPRRKSHLPSFSDQILVSQSVDVCPFDASRFSKSRGVAGSRGERLAIRDGRISPGTDFHPSCYPTIFIICILDVERCISASDSSTSWATFSLP